MKSDLFIKRFLLFATGFIFMVSNPRSIVSAWADGTSCAKPVVIIDPGHTKKNPGAISVTGKYEVEYNDNLVSRLSSVLTSTGFIPVLTRNPNQEIQLDDRVDIANSHNALVMLSIHHDSAQLVHLEAINKNGTKAFQTRKPISGYSIFVSPKNTQFDDSFIFAKLLGQELVKLGRKPTLHHAEPIHGENRVLLDADLGIYEFDDLIVLKTSNVPAVLLEVGVIVDPDDERYVANNKNQDSMISAITRSINKFSKMKRRRSKDKP